jgi:protein-S-isoprenylcysteine O-methyltransferase Ste14
MTRGSAALGSAVFFLIAPTTLAGVVPWWISQWRLQAPFFDLQLIRWCGAVLILLGTPVLLETFTRFALQGRGTPAPVAPTLHLVITGPNRFVRNPIYLALVAIVLGQGLILGNVWLLVYGALLWIGFHIFVLVYEEPTLRETFGAEYDTYCANVSRWLPRWPGPASAPS